MPVKTEESIEPGDYRIVTWDLDTTGRKLVDEICQIGAFCEDSEDNSFSQYVMPHRNPNVGGIDQSELSIPNIDQSQLSIMIM